MVSLRPGGGNPFRGRGPQPRRLHRPADNQVTVYNYHHDPYSPALVTRIKYPDSLDAAWDSMIPMIPGTGYGFWGFRGHRGFRGQDTDFC